VRKHGAATTRTDQPGLSRLKRAGDCLGEVMESRKPVAAAALWAAAGAVVGCWLSPQAGWQRHSVTGKADEGKATAFSLATTQRDLGVGDGGWRLYETESAIVDYLGFHFGTVSTSIGAALGDSTALLADAPARVALRCAALLSESSATPTGRALDVGCAVGGMSFALAEHFKEVVGVDTSAAFVRTAQELKTQDREYRFKTEGSAATLRVASCNELETEVRRRCCFHRLDTEQGSALPSALPVDLLGDGFDLILGCNLLCRLGQPTDWLKSLPSLISARGGLVVLISPYAWLEEWTAKEDWLSDTGESSAALEKIMRALGFELTAREEVPFFLPQNDRIGELFVSELTAWRLGPRANGL
jgi:SAM-dependent methyltransferase